MEAFWTQPRAISTAIILFGLCVGAGLLWMGLRPPLTQGKPRCPKCKYNMDGLDILECPDCGHEVGEIAEWTRRTRWRWTPTALRCVATVVLVCAAVQAFKACRFTLAFFENRSDAVQNRLSSELKSTQRGAESLVRDSFDSQLLQPSYGVWVSQDNEFGPWEEVRPWREGVHLYLHRNLNDGELNYIGTLKALTGLGVGSSYQRRFDNPFQPSPVQEVDRSGVGDDALRVIAGLPRLETLGLSATKIRGPGLAHLRSARWLTILSIEGSDIDSRSFEFIAEFPSLSYFQLSGNRVSLDRHALASLRNARHLKSLSLSSCLFNDDDVDLLGDIPLLTELDLCQSSVRDAGLLRLVDRPRPARITIHADNIKQQTIDQIQKAHPGKLNVVGYRDMYGNEIPSAAD